jgi:hypothetical protein
MVGYESAGAYVGIYFEAVILLIGITLILELYRIYRISKLSMTRDLLIGFTFVVAGIFFSWIAKFYLWQHDENALEGPYWLQLIYKFKMSLIMLIIGNYFVLMFFRTIFSSDYKRPSKSFFIIVWKIVAITILLTVHIPAYLTKSTDIAYITDSIGFFIVVADMLYLVYYGIKSFKSARNIDFGKKYNNIGLMGLFFFNVLVMFFIDRVTMALGIPGPFGGLGYTPFYFAAWISAIISYIFAIYGFVRK